MYIHDVTTRRVRPQLTKPAKPRRFLAKDQCSLMFLGGVSCNISPRPLPKSDRSVGSSSLSRSYQLWAERFERPSKHTGSSVHTNAWLKSCCQPCHSYLIAIWSIRVHRWLEQGGLQVVYRRFERPKFALAENDRFCEHNVDNHFPFLEKQELRPKEPNALHSRTADLLEHSFLLP